MSRRGEHLRTHGKSGTPTYRSWKAMRGRCNNPRHSKYKYYGARGVKVCERWNSYENFLADMGEKPAGPDYVLSRHGDVGNYEPGNCSWKPQTVNLQERDGRWLKNRPTT